MEKEKDVQTLKKKVADITDEKGQLLNEVCYILIIRNVLQSDVTIAFVCLLWRMITFEQ